MNAWTLFILVTGLAVMAGFFLLISCALRAPEGYEDEDGFHPGSKPAVQEGSSTLTIENRDLRVNVLRMPGGTTRHAGAA